MLRRSASVVTVTIGILSAVSSGGVAAEEQASHGTLSMAPTEAWATRLHDKEMANLRGGFRGAAFSVFFTGSVAEGMATNPGGVTVAPPPTVAVEGDRVAIETVVGNFAGFNGILQHNNVVGDFNVVNNNMFVQVVLINDGTLDLTSVMDALPTPSLQ